MVPGNGELLGQEVGHKVQLGMEAEVPPVGEVDHQLVEESGMNPLE